MSDKFYIIINYVFYISNGHDMQNDMQLEVSSVVMKQQHTY